MRRRGSGNGAEMRGRVGGCGRANSHRDLYRHVESARNEYSTVEQLVDHLRKSDPQYARLKLQPFTKRVEQIVEVLSRRNNVMDDSDYHDGYTPITNKRRKTDKEEEEEKLPLVGGQLFGFVNNGSSVGQASSVASASSSEGDDLSSSLDALEQEKHEGKLDLMKSMLREKLSQKSKILGHGRAANEAAESDIVDIKDVTKSKLSKESKEQGKKRGVEQVMEFELVDNKDEKEVVHLGNEQGELLGNVLSKSNNNNNGGRDGSEDINGPTFKDFGGMDAVIEELMENVILPFYHPQLPRYIGVKPITGILLHGPPGCGKTTLAEAIANETGVPFHKISAPALVSGVSGSSEQNIRELFSKADRTAPSIVFIDEIDAIATKRDNLRGMELRIVTQLITCMDESRKLIHNIVGSASSYCRPGYVLVIGATNRPDALDPALRRPGRFDCEVLLGTPDEYARVQILSKLTCNLRVEGVLDLVKMSRSTPGFVAADLEALVHKAGNLAMRKIIAKRKVELSKEQKDGARTEDYWRSPVLDEEMENLNVTMADFEEAVKIIQPSTKREGFSNIPNVKWDDVGGLDLLRQEFDRHIIRRIKSPELYENLGLDLETGFLLYGPPGCGKTLIAKAVANEAGANFIYIKGPELLSKYVGESESAVRTIFSRARTCFPCILFFDEIDALTTMRGKEGGWVVERLLNQLLVELDGAEKRKGVYVIGATNRPDVVDPALIRPGRLGKPVFVPLPSPDERGMILKALARNKLIDANVDLMAIGRDKACENFSGADLASLMNEVVLAANGVQLSGNCSMPLPAPPKRHISRE